MVGGDPLQLHIHNSIVVSCLDSGYSIPVIGSRLSIPSTDAFSSPRVYSLQSTVSILLLFSIFPALRTVPCTDIRHPPCPGSTQFRVPNVRRIRDHKLHITSWIAAEDPIIPPVIGPDGSCQGGDVWACLVLRTKRGIEPKPRIPMRHVFSSRTAQPWNQKIQSGLGTRLMRLPMQGSPVCYSETAANDCFGRRARDGSGTSPILSYPVRVLVQSASFFLTMSWSPGH